ncbi:hypothetical protein F2P56_032589, partial [Juglans regia]
SPTAQLEVISLQRCQIQIQEQNPFATRFLHHRLQRCMFNHQTFTHDGARPVPPHVAPQRLSKRELEPTNGTLMGFRLRWRGWDSMEKVSSHQPRLLVAGSVASQGLERRELPVARFAYESRSARISVHVSSFTDFR